MGAVVFFALKVIMLNCLFCFLVTKNFGLNVFSNPNIVSQSV